MGGLFTTVEGNHSGENIEANYAFTDSSDFCGKIVPNLKITVEKYQTFFRNADVMKLSRRLGCLWSFMLFFLFEIKNVVCIH